MNKIAVLLFFLAPLTSQAELNTLFGTCDGWPHESGTGRIEFYRNLSTFDSNSVLVRTDQLNGSFGSISITNATADDAWSSTSVTVTREQDPKNLYSSMKITLNKGKNLKTDLFKNGVKIAELNCSALE